MSLAVAVPCGVGAAIFYGASTAVQHAAAHTAQRSVDARRLFALLRNPRWLLSVGGDAIGLLLQVIALATGPVVLIQPLLVFAVPVSLPVGWWLGGPRPRRADLLASLAVVVGIGAFAGLVGDPGSADALGGAAAAMLAVTTLVAAVVLCLAVRRRAAPVRAGGYGVVAGGCFGVVGVLLNDLATVWHDRGLAGFGSAPGLAPLVGVLGVGAVGLTLTQVSFQVGALAASFPANEATAPVVAVLLGGLVLHERLPAAPGYVLGYLACLAVVIIGTVRLAATPGSRPRRS